MRRVVVRHLQRLWRSRRDRSFGSTSEDVMTTHGARGWALVVAGMSWLPCVLAPGCTSSHTSADAATLDAAGRDATVTLDAGAATDAGDIDACATIAAASERTCTFGDDSSCASLIHQM